MTKSLKEPMAPNDPVHVLGQKISALAEASDVETASNALLVCLRAQVMRMNDHQVLAFREGMPPYVAELLARRAAVLNERAV